MPILNTAPSNTLPSTYRQITTSGSTLIAVRRIYFDKPVIISGLSAYMKGASGALSGSNAIIYDDGYAGASSATKSIKISMTPNVGSANGLTTFTFTTPVRLPAGWYKIGIALAPLNSGSDPQFGYETSSSDVTRTVDSVNATIIGGGWWYTASGDFGNWNVWGDQNCPQFQLDIARAPIAGTTTTLNLTPTADTMLPNGTEANAVLGATDFMGINSPGQYWSNEYKSAVKFDLSSIPTGSVITSATLNLYMTQARGLANPYFIRITNRDNDFSDSSSYNTVGVGFHTWSYREWTFAKTIGWKNFDVTSQVLEWVNGYIPNRGFGLETAGASQMACEFATKEEIPSTLSPSLSVTYYLPNNPPNQVPAIAVNGIPGSSNLYVTSKRPNFSWTFSDPDAGDTQSSFTVAISNDGWTTWFTYGTGTTATSWQPTVDIPNGQWAVAVQVADASGSLSNWQYRNFFVDATAPDVPAEINGTLYATSNGVSWSAFSDGTSSGRKTTKLDLQLFNGSSWASVSGFPIADVGAILSYSFTGLTPGALYRWGIQYEDNAGNKNTMTYMPFTTNTYSISVLTNISSSGYTLNRRPAFRFTVVDTNDSVLTAFQIQVSLNSSFTSNVIDSTSGLPNTGWSANSMTSGGTVKFTPTSNISVAGTYYVRARAYDGKDWGNWSSTSSFTVAVTSWPTVIADDDTAISKRNIDSLRTAVNSVRQFRGLATVNWTDSTITDWTGAGTLIRAVHLTELRQAITDIYNALGNTAPVWTDPIITASVTDRKGKHWKELRTAIESA